MNIIQAIQEKLTMKTITVRGSPIFRGMPAATAIVILVLCLEYSSEVLTLILGERLLQYSLHPHYGVWKMR
jgi:hypothetical protein